MYNLHDYMIYYKKVYPFLGATAKFVEASVYIKKVKVYTTLAYVTKSMATIEAREWIRSQQA